jgi:hypothetical protein
MVEELSFQERKERWKILSAEIDIEISEHQNEATFVAEVYRSWRQIGLKPSEITPEMCHYGSE